jgi:hypothetical protein
LVLKILRGKTTPKLFSPQHNSNQIHFEIQKYLKLLTKMSKRKSRAKSMFVEPSDLVFEDDSDPDVAFKIQAASLKSSLIKNDGNKQEIDNAGVRISSRAKKVKNIYDPSEYNGPVHKKKKEQIEMANILAATKKSLSPLKVVPPKPKTPSKTPLKVPKSTNAAPKTPPPPKTPSDVKKKLNLDKPEIKSEGTTLKVSKPPMQATVPVPMREVTKRTAAGRKKSVQPQPQVSKPENKTITQLTDRDRSASTSGNSDFEKASTVEMDEKTIPNVSKWTSDDVYKYFVAQGFDKKESMKLKENEIDGEALMILNRNDLKELHLKVGTFVKIWNRILTFQTGSNDFTQGWK